MVLRSIATILFLAATNSLFAQYFQYSQYNYTSQRINPALVASSDYAALGMLYRHQATGGDLSLRSSFLSGMYPMISKKTKHRWSGIGVSVMDDRVGGIFATQEIGLSYALNVFLNRFQTLSLGFKGLYQQRKINMDGLFTGEQFIPDRGFDQSIFNGENIQFLRSDFMTFSTGLYWQRTDREGNKTAHWGISLFDFNKPEDSFSGVESHLNSTLIFHGGLRIYRNEVLSLSPEVLFTRSAVNNVLNAGVVTSYFLRAVPNQPAARFDIITKYVSGRSGTVGLQLHQENFSIGASYDFPVVKANVANVSAFEVGFELRKLVDPKLRRKVSAKRRPPLQKPMVRNSQEKKIPEKKETNTPAGKVSGSESVPVKSLPDLKSKLQHKQDSVLGSAEAGRIRHEPLMIERVTLHFNFEFNSTDLDKESIEYLDNLTSVLRENQHLRIRLTGHTDNIGSVKFNQRLSLFRANSIKEHFVSRGIDEVRIETDGRGLSEPLNANKTEAERAENRRVELFIFYED